MCHKSSSKTIAGLASAHRDILQPGTRLLNVEKARSETADPAPRLDILTHFWSLLIRFTVSNYLSINILSV